MVNGNLLDYKYFSNHYKLIAIDWSKQIESENPDLKQQINFTGKPEDEEATVFSIIENSEKKFFLNFYKIPWVSYKVETQKIINLLNDSSNEESKFATKNVIL